MELYLLAAVGIAANLAAYFKPRLAYIAPASAALPLAFLIYQTPLVYVNLSPAEAALGKTAVAMSTTAGAAAFLALGCAALSKRSRQLSLISAVLLLGAILEGARPYPQLNPADYPWALSLSLTTLASLLLSVYSLLTRRVAAVKWAWLAASLGLFLQIMWNYTRGNLWSWGLGEMGMLAMWIATTGALHYGLNAAVAAGAGLGAVSGILHGSEFGIAALRGAAILLIAVGLTRRPADLGRAVAGMGMAGVGAALFLTSWVGAAYALVYPLASAAFTGTAMMAVYHAGLKRWKRVMAIYGALIAVSAALSLTWRYAFESTAATNFYGYLVAGGAALAIWHVAKSQYGVLHKALHSSILFILILLSISGPYITDQGYYKLLAVDYIGAKYYTLLNWPYPQAIEVEAVNLTLDRNAHIPITPLDFPDYSQYLKKVGGPFSLKGINYTVAEVDGKKYVFTNGTALVEVNGTAVLFPAPLDLVTALGIDPGLTARFVYCMHNETSAAPSGVVYRVTVDVDGTPLTLNAGFNLLKASGGGLYAGAAYVGGVLIGYHVMAVPPGVITPEGAFWSEAVAKYAEAVLNQCNARVAYTALSLFGARNLTEAVAYVKNAEGIWILAFKPIPLLGILILTMIMTLIISILKILNNYTKV